MKRPLFSSRRPFALLAVVAATALAAVGSIPVTANAADGPSAVTVPANVGTGSYFTVSKTRNLVDGEQITVTGRIQEPPSGTPTQVGFSQTGTTYGSSIIQITDTPVATGASVADAEAGWSIVTAQLTVHAGFTTPDDGGNPSVSPGNVNYDCLVEQCFLAIGNGHWTGGEQSVPIAVANLPWNVINWVPITFAGGNAELTRDQAPLFNGQPSATTVDQGGTATFTAAAAGLPAPSIRWQSSGDDGVSWTEIAGATGGTLTVTPSATDDGRLYQAVASNRQGEIVSDAAAVTVVPAAAQPGDESRDPLTNAGSWVKLSSTSGLTDGQTITIEAEYTGSPYHSDDFPASGAMVLTQSGLANDPAMSRTVTESTAVWLTSTPLGNDRYRATGQYVVHGTLTGDADTDGDGIAEPRSYDCLVQQCSIEIGGDGIRADGSYIQRGTGDGDPLLAHLGQSGGTYDVMQTVDVPLYFAAGSLTPVARTAPSLTQQPQAMTVEENFGATFEAAATGFPTPSYAWQRSIDAGRTWTTIGGANSPQYTATATLDRNGSQYRARVSNALGTAYSDAAALTVTNAPDISSRGVSLDWTGSAEMQALSPARTANYFSAGSSDGTEAGYANTADGVSIVRRTASGTEQAASYVGRALHTTDGGSQIVRLQNGDAAFDSDGAGTISWDTSWTVNFYGGLVPFTISDPVLTIDASGSGRLTADVAGYGSSMEDPTVKVPLAPVEDVVVSTFSGARVVDGSLTIHPDYAGVEVAVDGSHMPQLRSGPVWGSWPQSWVDFQFSTGLSSYWYSSGGSADAAKPASAFTVTGITLPGAPTSQPTGVPSPSGSPIPGTGGGQADPGSGSTQGDPASSAASSKDGLASTGAEPFAAVLAALLLLLAGAGAVAARRSSRPARE